MKLLQWPFNPRTQSIKLTISVESGKTFLFVAGVPDRIIIRSGCPIDIKVSLAAAIKADVPLLLDIDMNDVWPGIEDDAIK